MGVLAAQQKQVGPSDPTTPVVECCQGTLNLIKSVLLIHSDFGISLSHVILKIV
jgi:hypothetical protein